jgi:hypothetical protein
VQGVSNALFDSATDVDVVMVLLMLPGVLVWTGRWRSWTRATFRREVPLMFPWVTASLAALFLLSPRGVVSSLTGVPMPQETIWVGIAPMLLGLVVGTTGWPKVATPPWYRALGSAGLDPLLAVFRAASRSHPEIGDRVVLLTSRFRVARNVALGTAVAAVGAWSLEDDLARGYPFGVLLSGLFAAIGASAAVVQLAALVAGRRTLTLDAAGLHDRTGVLRGSWSRRWDELGEAFLWNNAGAIQLAFVGRGPVAATRSPGARLGRSTALDAVGLVALGQFQRSEEDVLAVLLAFCRRHGVPVREPEPGRGS